MQGIILQVNVSRGGVPKRSIPEGFLTPHGVEGDAWAHPAIHGGPQKAVLLICSEVIDELVARRYPVFYGALGENLTTRGLDRRQMRPGQRYQAGEALVELVRVRAPCSTLDVYGSTLAREIYDEDVRNGDVTSPRWGMSGFYGAVVRSGWVRQNDIIALIDQVV